MFDPLGLALARTALDELRRDEDPTSPAIARPPRPFRTIRVRAWAATRLHGLAERLEPVAAERTAGSGA